MVKESVVHRETDFDGLAVAIGELRDPVSLAFRGNLGDALIRAGQLEIEGRSGRAVEARLRLGKNPQSVVIPGGGNLVEGYYNSAARALRSLAPDTPGIVLPHTVRGHYFTLRRHPRLTITCREVGSYDRLVSDGIEPRRLVLCHDTAFALQGSDLLASVIRGAACPSGTLVALRSDGESSRPMGSRSAAHARSFDVTGSASRHWVTAGEARRGAEHLLCFVAMFEHVVTDRLHVAVAAHLLDRPCWLLPNSYDKNRTVFQYSMAEGSARFAESIDDVPVEVINHAHREESLQRWRPLAIENEELTPREQMRRNAVKGRRLVRSGAKLVTSWP